jgi:cysteine desulfurase
MSAIYLDHNATTPLAAPVAEAMLACQRDGLANPASQHAAGRRARAIVEECRESIARILGAQTSGPRPDRLLFTSGGTEANNLAILGLAASGPGPLAVSAIEHPSVLGPAAHLSQQGRQLLSIPVARSGQIRLDELDAILAQQPALAAIMLGNNETGVLQPVADAVAKAAAAGVPVHCDAVQAAGKVPIDFRALGVASLALSAHKFHGPVGIGALLVRHDVPLAPLAFGGHQQYDLRPGTEPVALILGMAKALEWFAGEQQTRIERMTAMREYFEHSLLAGCPELVIHGRSAPRLPQTTAVAFPGVNRQAMFMALDLAGVACSTGSACSSGSSEPSPVLLAMGLEKPLVDASLRFSLGVETRRDDLDRASRIILQTYKGLRGGFSPRKIASTGRENTSIPL